MKFALLGPPCSGKKTFFSLLTLSPQDRREMPVSVHGLLRQKNVRKDGDALVGTARIHDERLVELARIAGREKIVFAENTIVLCPDVVAGDGGGKWLEPARRCDLLCVLLRAFERGYTERPPDPAKARSEMESELLLADLGMIETRLKRLEKEKRGSHDARLDSEKNALLKIKNCLETEMRLQAPDLNPQDKESVGNLGILSLKPVLWAHNVDENRMTDAEASGQEAFNVSCRIEQEIMELEDPDERAVYLKELGAAGSGVDRLNRAAYDALGLISFYTVGDNEVRAWTIRRGTSAREAAGKVHSDIQRGFIRVEITRYEDLAAAGKQPVPANVKGRDYIVEDGDICHFLFNV